MSRYLTLALAFVLGSTALGAANKEQSRLENCGVVMQEILDVPVRAGLDRSIRSGLDDDLGVGRQTRSRISRNLRCLGRHSDRAGIPAHADDHSRRSGPIECHDEQVEAVDAQRARAIRSPGHQVADVTARLDTDPPPTPEEAKSQGATLDYLGLL